MKKEMKISFTKSRDYKLIPATGIWGGVSPNGEIIANFLVEELSLPDELTITIENSKSKMDEFTSNKIVRELQFGVVLRPDIAYACGDWLINKAKQAGFDKK